MTDQTFQLRKETRDLMEVLIIGNLSRPEDAGKDWPGFAHTPLAEISHLSDKALVDEWLGAIGFSAVYEFESFYAEYLNAASDDKGEIKLNPATRHAMEQAVVTSIDSDPDAIEHIVLEGFNGLKNLTDKELFIEEVKPLGYETVGDFEARNIEKV